MLFIGGFALAIAIGVMIAVYHRFMQEQYEENIRQEFEERYDRDIELRWKNQDVRIHSRFVIVDEMKAR